MPRSLVVAVLFLPAAGLAAGLPLAVERIELDVRLDLETATLSGKERVTVENVSGTPVTSVPLNLNRLMRYDGVAEQCVVSFEDQPLLQVNHADVALPQPLAPHAHTTIDVAFGGPLVGYIETGSLYIKDTIDEAFTILRRDAYAFPVVGSRVVREPQHGHGAAHDRSTDHGCLERVLSAGE